MNETMAEGSRLVSAVNISAISAVRQFGMTFRASCLRLDVFLAISPFQVVHSTVVARRASARNSDLNANQTQIPGPAAINYYEVSNDLSLTAPYALGALVG